MLLQFGSVNFFLTLYFFQFFLILLDLVHVVFVSSALDDMTPELGPLEYVSGSHLWQEGRTGSAKQFYDAKRYDLLASTAARSGIKFEDLDIVSVIVPRGGAGIHNGRTWHGSDSNSSSKTPRRGIGIHFVPSHCKFRKVVGRMWQKFKSTNSDEMKEADFPITYQSTV
jgi:ectoine hydroxylase-related dioxygenase (phytanoyl-CoA dioxygenase family)